METSDGIPNAVDSEKLAEIENLLRGSDAGNVQYDKDGNAVFDEKVAQKKYEAALEKNANGIVDESQSEPEQPPAETLEPEASADAESETADAEAEPEPEKATPTWDDDIQIPLPDGRDTVTLGQMKDEFVDLLRNRDAMNKLSNDLATERLIVNEILNGGGEVSQERIDQLKAMNESQRQRDIDTITQMYPQWKTNEHQRAADFERMMNAGKLLGATEAELKSITRPWLVHMLKTVSDYMAREQGARAKLKAVPMPRHGNKKPTRPQTGKAAKFGKVLSDAQGNAEGADWAALDQALR